MYKFGGWERDEEELKSLLEYAGLVKRLKSENRNWKI